MRRATSRSYTSEQEMISNSNKNPIAWTIAAAMAIGLTSAGAPTQGHAATATAASTSAWAPHAEFDGLWRTAGRRGPPPGGGAGGPPGGGPGGPPGGAPGGPPGGGPGGGRPGGQPQGDQTDRQAGPGGKYGCCTEEGWGDVSTLLQPWALDIMLKRAAGLASGKIIPTTTQECKPDGWPTVGDVPYPFQILQTPKETLFLHEADYQVRHIRMSGTHSATFKPNWFGDSVGKWDGDTLVIDTVGLSKQGQINWDGVPHTDQMHVESRYRVTAPGQMELTMTITDPGTLTRPWIVVKHFRRVNERKLMEYVCAENNRDADIPTE